MKRIQGRRSNGQFRRNTLENTFGLSTRICPDCGALNPYRLRFEQPPDLCSYCGYHFASQSTIREQFNLLILLG